MFATYGVPEYWIFDPARQRIDVRALQDGAYRLAQTASAEDTVRSILLPELTFSAARVLAVP